MNRRIDHRIIPSGDRLLARTADMGDQSSPRPVGAFPQSAYAVIFFASDRARMIAGQRLVVNAGEFYDT